MAREGLRFFLIGGQRCGTTLLHRRLDAHPDVVMHQPVRPEPKHFLDHRSADTDPDEYDRCYFPESFARVRGEKGTTYIERPDAASRILRCFPAARFVVVVRDPVDRAISNFRFSTDHELEALPPEQALTPEAERRPWDENVLSASPYAYLQRGQYAEQLDAWADIVGRAKMFVLRFEDVISGKLGDLQSFLGLDPVDLPIPSRPVNQARAAVRAADLEQVRRTLAIHYLGPNDRLRRDWQVDTTNWLTP